VLAVWTGSEQARFEEVVRAFEAETGASVSYAPAGHRIADALAERRASDELPDVAFVPQPGLLRQYARDGLLAPLDAAAAEEVSNNFPKVWIDLGSADGRLYGVWFKAANKSLVWYRVGAFERAGVVPPRDLEGFASVAREITAAGIPAFALGAHDGWTLTDWFENVYLRLAGPDRYDELAAHRLAWTDESVKEALRMLASFWSSGAIAGGAATALESTFEGSVQQAFGGSSAAMVVEGDFVQGFITSDTAARPGIDADVFAFPSPRGGQPVVMGGGDAAVVLHDSPAAQAFVRFLATPRAAAIWAAHGGYISPNFNVDLTAYPDAISRSIARRVVEAGDQFRFDLSDLQPAAFGGSEGQGLRGALQEFLVTGDVDATASRLEADATAAYG
jgi:ABC-type glycerol-3-phosphate transport system substrate-binding protein